jgi:hypothetical protein
MVQGKKKAQMGNCPPTPYKKFKVAAETNNAKTRREETPKYRKGKPDQKKRVMILRCIDVEDMRIQTKRQAKSWIDIIEHRLKRLGDTV